MSLCRMKAMYVINVKEKIPASLSLSGEILELVGKDFGAGLDFKEELELVTATADQEDSSPRFQSDLALNLNEGVEPADVLSAAAAAQGSLRGATAITSPSSSSSSSSLSPSAAAASASVALQRQKEEALEKDAKVTAMAMQTGQERDVCIFYLESCNYDIPGAIALLNQYSTRD